jgi:hypothetical protein
MATVSFDIEHTYSDHDWGIVLDVELNGKGVRFLATLDTGAAYCIFQSDYADLLDLTLKDGIPLTLSLANGARIEAYGHEVTMTVLGRTVSSVVYFTDAFGFRRNVLGRRGWIDLFKLGIVYYQSKLYLGDLDHQ